MSLDRMIGLAGISSGDTICAQPDQVHALGTGLGLFSHGLVKDLQETLESESGKYTRFLLNLPIK